MYCDQCAKYQKYIKGVEKERNEALRLKEAYRKVAIKLHYNSTCIHETSTGLPECGQEIDTEAQKLVEKAE